MDKTISDKEIESCLPLNLRLRPFQYDSVRALALKKKWLIADDPGLGKTISLTVACNYIVRKKPRTIKSPWIKLKVLVLCPKSLILNWKREVTKWGRSDLEFVIYNYDKLVPTTKEVEFKKATKTAAQVNYVAPVYRDFVHEKYDIVIMDESHQVLKIAKGGKPSQRYTCIKNNILENADRIWLSTATPASTWAMDYYRTLEILLPGLMKDYSEWSFKKRFCEEEADRWSASGFRYDGFQNTQELKLIFSQCALKHRFDDVQKDLPPKVYTPIEIEVDKKLVVRLLDVTPEELNVLIDMERPWPGYFAQVMKAAAISKIPYLADLVSNYEGQKLVIFAWHQDVVEAAVAALRHVGRKVDFITGEVTSSLKRQSIVDKLDSGELDTVVLNFIAGGVGLNFQCANTAIYLEHPRNPEQLKQTEGRIRRIGSVGKSINYIRLVGSGTCDQEIFDILDKRLKKVDAVGM